MPTHIQKQDAPERRWEVLIISSDQYTIRAVQEPLLKQGYQTRVATSEWTGLLLLSSSQPDVIVLDIASREYNGWKLCGRLREMTTAPILMLSQNDDTRELVKGIRMGADVYMPKPVNSAEFLARVQSLLRPAIRQHQHGAERPATQTYFTLDPVYGTVTFDDHSIQLTNTEMRLFSYLASRCNMIVPKEELLEAIWGIRDQSCKGSLHLYISRLRQKLEADPQRPKYIHTYWGVGYWLSSAPTDEADQGEILAVETQHTRQEIDG